MRKRNEQTAEPDVREKGGIKLCCPEPALLVVISAWIRLHRNDAPTKAYV